MNEYEFIKKITSKFKRSPLQRNKLFESDSEIVEIDGRPWGMSMDEFSPEEDLFTSADPFELGSNLAVAVLSDLFASGIRPVFYMHALSLPHDMDEFFAEKLLDGIKNILDKSGCMLCGGDTGTSVSSWRYCGFAIGPAAVSEPLTRVLPVKRQSLMLTGFLGDANLAAFAKTETPHFELRNKEADFISRKACGCIDTSGGFIDALWLLKKMNPLLRFEIHMESLPLCAALKAFSEKTGIPREAALVGGAGEYELLFACDVNQAIDISASKIADVFPDAVPGVFFFRNGRPISELREEPLSPRNFKSIDLYSREVIATAGKLFL